MPSYVVSSATRPTFNPTSRATLAVFGPMQTSTLPRRRRLLQPRGCDMPSRSRERPHRRSGAGVFPHRRLDENRAIGDDVDVRPLVAQFLRERRFCDVRLRHEHALPCELAQPGCDVVRGPRRHERRLDAALANRAHAVIGPTAATRRPARPISPSLTAATPFTLVKTIQS